MSMSAFSMLCHNGNLIREAEEMLNSFLDINSKNHKTYLYVENPDGTRVALQPGFKLIDLEYVIGGVDDGRTGWSVCKDF